MASPALVDIAGLSENELVLGVIENIVTTNKFFDVLPFDSFDGTALAYNRELVLGGAGVAPIGAAITAGVFDPITAGAVAKNPSTVQQILAALTTIIGDAELNGLIEATMSDVQDQKAVQIAGKAKYIGRIYQWMMVNGTGGAGQFAGLNVLCAVGQQVNTGVAGAPLSFAFMDNLIDLVTDKNGDVDYFMFPSRTVRAYFTLLRALGGAGIGEVVELPSGAKLPAYRGIPIFVNNWISTAVVKGGQPNTTSIYAGTLDDGTRTHGIAGLTAKKAAGIQVVSVGEKEDADESITRVKWYCGMALFSQLGLALADGIRD